MVNFIIYTTFFLLATAAFAKVMHISIQQDQWLDKLLGWQNNLQKWGANGGFWNEYRYRSWGGCEVCFSRFISFICYGVYVFMMIFVFNVWIHTDYLITSIIANFVMFISFTSLSTILNILVINKLFKSE